MKNLLLIMAILLGFRASAQDPETDFEKANAAYKEEKYSEREITLPTSWQL